MALSGSNYKSFARHRLVVEWSATQNIAKNQSTVTVKVFLQNVDAYGALNAPASNAGSVKVGTTTKNFTATSQLSANQKKQLTSQSFVVSHNANGTGSFSYSVTYNINVSFSGVFYGNQTVSGTGTLNTIPRASSIGTISGDTMGSGITIPINRASTAFKHKVTISMGGASVSTGNTNVDTTTTLTPTTASFAPKVTNATSGTATVTLVTYNGTTQIGSAVSKTFTLKVPTSVKPSISEVSASETVKAVADLGLGTDRYVQNKSGIKVNAKGGGAHGSTIKSLSIKYNGQTLNGSGSVFNIGKVTGSQTITITATDSRGRTATTTKAITVLAYSPPKIVAFKVWRDGTTKKVRASLECSIDLLYKADGTTAIGGNWYIDANVSGAWGNKNSGALAKTTNSYKNTNILITGDYDVTKSFGFRVRVTDAFGQGPIASASVSTAKTLLDFNQDIGVGIGKLHERGALDVGGDVHINGGTHSLRGTVNWTPPTSASTAVYTHLYRNSGEMLGALYHSTTDDVLSLNVYNKAGNYKIHKFKNNGDVLFSNNVDVQGKVGVIGAIATDQHIWARTTITADGAIRGAVESGNLTYVSGFASYSGNNWLGKTSRVVQLSARIKNTNAFNGHDAEVHIATLPSGFRPQTEFNAVMQGSVRALFLMTIRPDGKISLSRYRNDGSAFLTVPAGSWLNCNATFLV